MMIINHHNNRLYLKGLNKSILFKKYFLIYLNKFIKSNSQKYVFVQNFN